MSERIFIDTENWSIVSESVLRAEWNDDETFAEHLENSLDQDGFLLETSWEKIAEEICLQLGDFNYRIEENIFCGKSYHIDMTKAVRIFVDGEILWDFEVENIQFKGE